MPTNGFNQSAAWGGGATSSQGDASGYAQGGGLQPPKRPRQQFQTSQPPQPQGAPAPQPTFAQMQQQGQARPNPRPIAQPQPQPVASPGGVGGDLQTAVQSALQNPSRYDLPQVQQVRQALQGDLNQQYDYQKKSLNEEMAKRGLSESTIAGQRYSDLGSEQARAMANIDAQLLQNYAATQAQDLSASLGAGQNYQNAENSTGLANRQLDQQGSQFNLQQALAEKLGLGGLGLQEKQLDQQDSQFDAQQALAEKLGLGGLGLQEKELSQQGSQFDKSLGLQQQQLQQSGSQFDRSLAQSGSQFNLQQTLAEKLGLGNLDLQKASLAQSGSQFDKSLAQSGKQFDTQQTLAERLGLGNLDLQKQTLAQSGSQFDKSYALQQAAQKLDEEVKRGTMTLQQAQQKLNELAQSQNYELGQSAQELQKQQLEQSGQQGNINLLLQLLNSAGGGQDVPGLAAMIAQMLGLTPAKNGGNGGGNGGAGGGGGAGGNKPVIPKTGGTTVKV